MLTPVEAPADRFDHAQLSSSMIANVIRDALRDDLELSIKNVRSLVQQRYRNVKPSYSKLWRGRDKAIAQLFGSWEGSYGLLIPFLQAIKALKTQVQSMSFCQSQRLRKDGRYKGRLLIACGYDANNQLLPLAFAIVEKEDSANWGWFMRWLRSEPHIGWNESAGECVHRLCSQHVAENLWKFCRNEIVLKTFKWTVKKKKPRKFDGGMSSIANICPEAITYIKKVGKHLQEDKDEQEKPEKVFQCKDGGYCWGIMTSNGSESLNNVFKFSRRLPMAAIVEETFSKCLEWFVERRRNAVNLLNNGKQWSQRVDKLLVKRGNKAGHMNVISYGDEVGIYEVKVDKS
ncbi:hypothetical protein OsI_28630 [Oryza sativa Indica Group]|uniref:MULE transposase domain-containing protein n=1 Tax=Oryza sativa subsp. indica TaxID=39946 RepID=B8B984_ORYSI|nr:hypothetical protein OsI_28630 [Oryza sativa Indica Group]